MAQQELRPYLDQADSFFKQKLGLEGERVLLTALGEYPDSITVLNRLAQFYLEQTAYPKFKEIFKKIRRLQRNELSEVQHMWLRQYIRETADWENYQVELDWFHAHLTADSVPFYVMGMPFSEADFLTVQQHFLRANRTQVKCL